MSDETQEKSLLQKTGAGIAAVGAGIAAVYRAATRDGVIDAFLRQGVDEIGVALKPFGESIQTEEPGQAFSPLYSDIAADKRQRQSQPSPGDLADSVSPKITPQASTSQQVSPGDLAEGKGVEPQAAVQAQQRQAIRMSV
ncbi:hypothetical protein [Paludisphaera borealis]|uniref:Uncharacterized protein n=1 Tax=Paludisphaera borealis TaxID=1387353 RepID=A0A1U7CZI3_9BACT|nr:hypothetical protein [Paludisphaera borealis]APW64298.1 hypothetical protein BSF38_20012 [Paludisphaera borealis]